MGVPISTSYLPKGVPKKGGKWPTYLFYKYIYIHIHTYIHTYIYIYICMCIYVCICTCGLASVLGAIFCVTRKFEVSARTIYLVYVQPICVAHGAKGWDQMHHMHGAKADLQVYLWRVVYIYN